MDQNYQPAEDTESASDQMLFDHLCGSDQQQFHDHHRLFVCLIRPSTMLRRLGATWIAEWLRVELSFLACHSEW